MKTNPDVNEALNKAKYLQSSLRSKIPTQEYIRTNFKTWKDLTCV